MQIPWLKKARITYPRQRWGEKRLFELLRKSYIDARYTKGFKVEKEELGYLSKRVQVLRELTKRVCGERMQGMEG